MPSPMDECDNVININPSPSTDLKRKVDGSLEELIFPCKKIAISQVHKSNSPEDATTSSAVAQVKLTKAEREVLKMEKAREREMERQKRELERQTREEEKHKREEERLKKVCDNTFSMINLCSMRNEMN